MTLPNTSDLQGCLPGTNEVFVADAIVTSDEQSCLVEWAEARYREGTLLDNPVDSGAHSTPFRSTTGELTRFTRALSDSEASSEQKLVWLPQVDEALVPDLPEDFWRIRTRVIELYGLQALAEDHYKGSFLSYIAPGAGVHQHRDARLSVNGEELLILRCNVLFKRPSGGGMPMIESKEVDVPDRGMWLFFPTELVHSATTVQGFEFRGMLSYGFLVRSADLWQRRFSIDARFVREFGLDSGISARRALLNQLKQAPAATSVGKPRLDLLEVILSAATDFSVQEAAEALGQLPSETWELLRDLQRSELVASRSSEQVGRGRVMVF